MISTRLRGRTAAERLAAKKARQQQRKAAAAAGGGGQEGAKGPGGLRGLAGAGAAGGLPMLPLVPQFDSFGRPVVSPSAAARDPYAIPKKSEQDQQGGGRPRIVLSQDPVIRVMIDDSVETDYESLGRNSIHFKLRAVLTWAVDFL